MRIQFADFEFDDETRELRASNQPVHLTPKAFELLKLLIGERPRAMRKDELRDRLWPDVVVADANLKNLVVEIRGALGADTVRTVQRYGYAFAGSEETTSARFVSADRTYPLRFGENIIGREPGCAVALDVTGVSRHHAKVHIAGDRFVLEDLGSKNGTWKNDEQITKPVELQDGDRVRIGAVSLTFLSSPAAGSTTTVG